ncbi:MAG: PAS domain-containing sensor histidine kinase [Candidatus Kapabacteria bacterium]|nr:PAS domain-containing sensor histidine kinase [Candidatus Kapabacteria bacterium]
MDSINKTKEELLLELEELKRDLNELEVRNSILESEKHVNIISESVQNEMELRRAEEFAKFGYWNLYIDEKIIRASDGAKNIYGLEKNENSLEMIQGLALPEYRPMLDKALKDLLENNIPYEVEFKIRRQSDGRIVDIYSKKEYDPIQKIAFGVIQDITEKKKSDEEILKFKRAVETSGDAIFLADITGIITYINPEFTNLYGYSSEEIIGKTTPRILKSGLIDQETYKNFWITILNKQVVKGELVNKTKDGSFITIESSANPILDDNSDIIGFLSVQRDISERKKLEQLNLLHREQLQTIIDKLPNYIFVKDIDGFFLMANKAFAELFYLSPSEILNKTDVELNLNQEHIEDYRIEDLEVINSNKPKIINEEIFTLDTHEKIYIQTIKLPYKYPGWDKPCILGISTDMTEIRRVEDELISARNEWELTFNTITDMITVHDNEFNIIRSNQAAQKILKLPIDSLAKVKCFHYFHGTDVPHQDCASCKSYESGDACTIELYEKYLDMYIEIRAIPRYDKFGNISGIIHVVRDISDRKKAEDEKEELLEQLRISNEIIESELFEKNSLIDELTKTKESLEIINSQKDKFFSIIAHDIKGPFSGFLGLSRIIAEEYQDLTMKELQEFGKSLQESANNLYKLLDNLLEWSRMQRGVTEFNPETCNLKYLLEQNLGIVNEFAKQKNIELTCYINEDEIVTADVRMLNTVIRNLISNAIKFTPRGGKIEIGLLKTENSLNQLKSIYIKDSGIGMSDDIIGKLFKLDQKVSRPGTENEPSTGLGLLLCKEFIERHGGKIWVESEIGKGSTFIFSLPNIDEERN